MRPMEGKGPASGSHLPDTPAEEAELIRRIAQGERSAVEPLFHRFHDRLFRYLARVLRDEGAAEELANEVILDVWKGAGRFEGRSSVSSWIFSIAHNKAVSYLRKKREVYMNEDETAHVADSSDTPSELVEKSNMSEILKNSLEELSPAHREVIDLTYFHGMSIREIAGIVGIPENTVKTRMFHARKKLAEIVRAAGIGDES